MPLELSDSSSIIAAIESSQPDELYNLAAQSFVGASFENPIYTTDVSGLGVVRLLEVVRHHCPKVRLYQASTSEMYGDNRSGLLSEETSFLPSSPYAGAKLLAHNSVKIYRKSYNLFLSNGILFNHESPLRGLEFVTRKITNEVAKIKLGLSKSISLGNINSSRDWGYAPDYVEAMWRILQQDKADDYVLATGETHTVREFVDLSFNILGENILWEGEGIDEVGILESTGKEVVGINPRYFRPTEVDLLIGDYSKAKENLGWERKRKFENLVKIMVEKDYRKIKENNGL